MNQVPEPIKELRKTLEVIKPGPVGEPDTEKIIGALAGAWEYLSGFEATRMSAWKLGRYEHLTWDPPCLVFEIERHGGTGRGSSRAEIQQWRVNVDTLVAECCEVGRRQVRPRDKPLDTRKLAEEVATKIIGLQQPSYLDWKSPRRVHLKIGQIISATNKATTLSRRKRFRSQLTELLEGAGWYTVKGSAPHTYEKGHPPGEDIDQ